MKRHKDIWLKVTKLTWSKLNVCLRSIILLANLLVQQILVRHVDLLEHCCAKEAANLDLTEGVAKLQHSHLRASICSSACHTRLDFFDVPQLLRSGAQKPLNTQWKTSVDLPAWRGRGTGPGTRPVEFTLWASRNYVNTLVKRQRPFLMTS